MTDRTRSVDHELEDIYDRLYKLSESLKETVEIVKKLQSLETYDVDVDEDGPFKVKVTSSTRRAHQDWGANLQSVIGKIKKPSLVPGGTEDD